MATSSFGQLLMLSPVFVALIPSPASKVSDKPGDALFVMVCYVQLQVLGSLLAMKAEEE